MNISFSPTFARPSTQFEVTPPDASQENRPANGTAIASPSTKVGASADTQAEQQSNNSDQGKENKSNEGSQQSRREALSNPSSALSKELQGLQTRDREVRTHEQAHLAAAGAFALGGPVYDYQQGPDGQRYAIGGHVNIDTSEIAGDPEATLRKAQTISRAALAPAEPSSQDRQVASQASNLANQAQQELSQLRQQETEQVRAATQSNESESDEPDSKPNEDFRNRLEENIRNTGALGETSPTLDLTA
ncbi:MAG: putative metalloprotease CJM1_0395 family protein [Pseudomonadales bacterium]